jgi:hypothetical protein
MTTINKTLKKIIETKDSFFVDIGCSDVSEESQTEILIDYGWSGVMFEYDITKFNNQKNKMGGKPVDVIHSKVTPENVLDLLKSNNVPNSFYLSIDIDGYDFYVIEKILQEYRPSIIVSEINEKIPPGVKFSVKYEEDYWWGWNHFYGYSISMLELILDKFNYKISELDYNNVVLIPGKQEESIESIYNNGYLNREGRKEIFSYNSDFEGIYTLSKNEQINFINEKFIDYKGKYIIS